MTVDADIENHLSFMKTAASHGSWQSLAQRTGQFADKSPALLVFYPGAMKEQKQPRND